MDDFLNMTPAEQHDWYRNQVADTHKLAAEVTQFLKWLRDRTLPGPKRSEHGMWNCQEWLLMALRANNIQHHHGKAKGKRAENVSFELHGGIMELAEHDVRLDTISGADPIIAAQSNVKYLGTLVQLSLFNSSDQGNYVLRVRWFAFNSELADRGTLVDDFYQGRWAFPQHVWCYLLGHQNEARDWLMQTKLSFK